MKPLWILSYPRTGSYFLASILNAAGPPPAIREYYHFTETRRAGWVPRFNKTHFMQLRNWPGVTLGDAARVYPDIRFVRIRRRDLVAAAVSVHLAWQTEVWMLRTPEERERLEGAAPVVFSGPRLVQEYRHLEWMDRAWGRSLKGYDGRVREVFYEDLAADPVGVAAGLFAWLGVGADPAACVAASPHEKQSGLRPESAVFRRRLAGLLEREAAERVERAARRERVRRLVRGGICDP